jgi:4-amino-4-deoxy-L-arabinose transferase-like glycosyltransferase
VSAAATPRAEEAPGEGGAAAPGGGSHGRRPSRPLARILAPLVRRASRIPRAGRVCFLIAFVNAAIWGVVVPPFQVPDEISHFGYAQYLAETGRPPPQGAGAQYSPEEQDTLEALDFFSVIGRAGQRGILTPTEDHTLRALLATHPSPLGEGGASSATNQPPLYYALEAVPYLLSPSHDILTRLALMRLLSALMAACTVLAVFLFLRELLPRTPWAWTVGALMVAFQPTFDFIAAGVHGDNLLFLTATLTFLVLLRTYRRGLTTRRAVALGAIVAAGVLTKLTFIALLPGIALALLLLGWRARPRGTGRALRMVALAVAVAAVPVALYALLNVVAWHRGGATAGGFAGATNNALPGGGAVTLRETLDYTWQLYLPKLWFMNHTFFAEDPIWITWLDGSIGHFGWLDYTFPAWVYNDGLDILYALLALALVGLIRARAAIRPMLGIFACFGVMALGLLGAIGYAGIRYQLSTGYPFAQARYLFPLVVFYALFIVLAARALPRRWAPLLGALLVVLAMVHGLFAETLTISRYYG